MTGLFSLARNAAGPFENLYDQSITILVGYVDSTIRDSKATIRQNSQTGFRAPFAQATSQSMVRSGTQGGMP